MKVFMVDSLGGLEPPTSGFGDRRSDPTELQREVFLAPQTGIEPVTPAFSRQRSTN